MNTDEELLNNEQKLVTRVIRKFNTLDKTSLANFLNDIYDEDSIDKLVKHYYSNKENRSWSDILFQVTYNCLGILNLNHLLTYKISEYLEYVLDNETESNGQEVTKEVIVNIFKESSVDIDKTKKINLSELINTCLLIYTQNSDTCVIEDDGMYGGNKALEFFLQITAIICFIGIGFLILISNGGTFEDFCYGFLESILDNLFN
jgi:hypothetical protein